MGNWWTNRAHLLTSTVFVAAWNASDMEKRCADVICTGYDDQDTINEAMATAHRRGRRRELYLPHRVARPTVVSGRPSDVDLCAGAAGTGAA